MRLGGLDQAVFTTVNVLDKLGGLASNFRDLGNAVSKFSGAFTSGVFAGFNYELAMVLGKTLNKAAEELKRQSETASAKDPKAMIQLTAAADSYRTLAQQTAGVMSALGDASSTLSRRA
jgi:hypothetical protein